MAFTTVQSEQHWLILVRQLVLIIMQFDRPSKTEAHCDKQLSGEVKRISDMAILMYNMLVFVTISLTEQTFLHCVWLILNTMKLIVVNAASA